jgi:hypothetical protein
MSKKEQKLMFTLRLVILFLVVFISDPASSADTPIKHIKSVIQKQLEAFSAGDYEGAYQYASRNIQSALSLEEFEVMVRNGFPQMTNSRRTAFGRIVLSKDGTRAEAIVHVTGTDHVTIIARYELVREALGWKNNGVTILEHITPI